MEECLYFSSLDVLSLSQWTSGLKLIRDVVQNAVWRELLGIKNLRGPPFPTMAVCVGLIGFTCSWKSFLIHLGIVRSLYWGGWSGAVCTDGDWPPCNYFSYARGGSGSYGKYIWIKHHTFIHSLPQGWEAWKASGEMPHRENFTGCLGWLSPASLSSGSAAWHGVPFSAMRSAPDKLFFLLSVFAQWGWIWTVLEPFHKGRSKVLYCVVLTSTEARANP